MTAPPEVSKRSPWSPPEDLRVMVWPFVSYLCGWMSRPRAIHRLELVFGGADARAPKGMELALPFELQADNPIADDHEIEGRTAAS